MKTKRGRALVLGLFFVIVLGVALLGLLLACLEQVRRLYDGTYSSYISKDRTGAILLKRGLSSQSDSVVDFANSLRVKGTVCVSTLEFQDMSLPPQGAAAAAAAAGPSYVESIGKWVDMTCRSRHSRAFGLCDQMLLLSSSSSF